MKKFKDLGIKPTLQQGFVGDKIKMERILNRTITVHDFRIEDSKFKGKYLCLQITLDDTKRVVFTGASALIDTIQRVPKTDFPFVTTIVRELERYEFT